MTALVDPIRVVQEADTPLGAAIGAVSDDLASATGTRILIVITDSEEVWPHPDLCGRDPARSIRGLRRQGIDARVHIVGFGVRDKDARAQLRRWARLGGGSWFDARDADQLTDAVRQAVSAPFQVFAQDGSQVAEGIVGGSPVKLPPGVYRLVVLSDPQAVYEGIVIESEGSVTVTLPLAGDQPEPDGSPGPGTSPVPSP
ncbi:MAG: VWA domain-containing protein [Solirubrobacterales bacterium]|nr:VWA domain-containing protein [Solirubrobacterales bacterium]